MKVFLKHWNVFPFKMFVRMIKALLLEHNIKISQALPLSLPLNLTARTAPCLHSIIRTS